MSSVKENMSALILSTAHEAFTRDSVRVTEYLTHGLIEVEMLKGCRRKPGFEQDGTKSLNTILREAGCSGWLDFECNGDGCPTVSPPAPSLAQKSAEIRKRVLRRIRSESKNIVLSNPWDFFVTLTCSPDKVDRLQISVVMSLFAAIVKRHNRTSSVPWKYFIVPEQHESGAWHLHGFFSGMTVGDLRRNDNGYLEIKDFADNMGYTAVEKVPKSGKKVLKMLRYCLSYCEKSLDSCGEGYKHGYYCSNGLSRTEKVVVNDESQRRLLCRLLSEASVGKYENEWYIQLVLPISDFEALL